MSYHILPAFALSVTSLLLFYPLYLLASWPRDVLVYAGFSFLLLLEWVSSSLAYRLLFHPLAKYPGPLLGALTDWYTVYWIAEGSRHLHLDHQHGLYGKIVRTGPNRLSINSAAASRDLHSVNANALKADVYGGSKRLLGADSSMSTTNQKIHAFRRRINMAAMTPSCVKDFAALITPHVDDLMRIVAEDVGASADSSESWGAGRDMSRLFAFCIADMMGSVTFSQTWNVQRETKYRQFVKNMPNGAGGMHLFAHVPSLFRLSTFKLLFKELHASVIDLKAMSTHLALSRMERTEPHHRDIWSTLLSSRDPVTGSGLSEEELVAEAALFIVAGTDVMITALSATIFYLLHNPTTLQRLTREVRQAFPLPHDTDRGPETLQQLGASCPIEFCSSELNSIKYLFACIDEAMRLSPSVPGMLPRVAGPGGIVLDGDFFPEGTNLGIPHYSLHRDEEFFPEPRRYRPERWMSEDPEKCTLQPAVGQAASYTPFGMGRNSCIGKYMAYQDMSYILARMVWLFDMRLDPENKLGEGTGVGSQGWGRNRRDEFQLFDKFVAAQDGPVVQFRYREELRGTSVLN